MIRSQIKYAIRNIVKNLGYNVINILGLTIGISCTLLILLYVFDELNYDNYHEHKDTIYRVVSDISETDDSFTWLVTQLPFAMQIKQDYPEVIEATRVTYTGKNQFRVGDKSFYEELVCFADSTIFNVFTYEIVSGDPNKVLSEPNSIVVTRSFAEKYFGKENPVGKMIDSEGNSLKITGLIEDVPSNSHLDFSALISWSTRGEENSSWYNFGVPTYLRLKPNTDPDVLNKKFEDLYGTYMKEVFEPAGVHVDYVLQPLTKIHLYPVGKSEVKSGGDIQFILIFTVIAAFLLIIAGINYMNLATARSVKRSREVGIRKTVGASKGMLIRQFITESVVLTFIALILSLGICDLLLPSFNELTEKSMDFAFFFTPPILLSMLVIIIVLGVLSGSYPAFFLSGFNPINVIKGVKTKSSFHGILRKLLVVLQFSISLAMIICTWIVFQQMTHLKNKDMGFQKESIIRVNLHTREMFDQFDVLSNELKNVAGVVSIGSSSTPLGVGSGKLLLEVETSEGMQQRGINLLAVDYDFIETMGIEILEGRCHSRENLTDTLGVVVNETLAERLGWKNPLGKKISFGEENTARVIGLMKDYHQTGLYSPVESLLLYLQKQNPVIYVKLEKNAGPQTFTNLEEAWLKAYPGKPFEYTWLEGDLHEQVAPDEKRSILFVIFSIIVIIIACLGIFGLASFTLEQRTKEVAIRKVLGAENSTIITLLLKDYLMLIAVAVIIAFPAAYFYMSKFLEDYVYRIEIQISTFFISAALILVITLLTVFYHIGKTARSNATDALKID